MASVSVNLHARNRNEDEILIFSSLGDAKAHIKKEEIETNNRYIIGYSTKNFGNSVVTSSSHKVCWVHGVNPYMYVSLGHQVLKCHHGTDKNKKKKMEKEKTKTFSSEQHSYAKKKTRHALQPSKKMDCPASIILKEVLIFTPEEGSSRELDKKMAASNVRSDLSKGIKKIMVVFPNVEHKYHTSGENAGLLQRIDSDVASKIKELVVEDGVANVEEMQRHLTSFVTKNVTPAPSKTNRRFAPTKKVIRYHMNKAAKNGCDSSDDQHNLVQLAIECVRFYIKEAFLEKIESEPYLSTMRQVKGLQDQELLKILSEDKYLGGAYVEHVLVREALAAIFVAFTGDTYTNANVECCSIIHRSTLRAMQAACAIGEAKKNELLNRYKHISGKC